MKIRMLVRTSAFDGKQTVKFREGEEYEVGVDLPEKLAEQFMTNGMAEAVATAPKMIKKKVKRNG